MEELRANWSRGFPPGDDRSLPLHLSGEAPP